MIADDASEMGVVGIVAAVAAGPIGASAIVDEVDNEFAERNEVGERRHGHFAGD